MQVKCLRNTPTTQKQNNNKYQQEIKSWEDNLTTNNPYWSSKQLETFYGANKGNVTYVNAGTASSGPLTLQVINGTKVPKELYEYDNQLSLSDKFSKEVGLNDYYYLYPGLSWKYTNAFKDGVTGKNIDLKITVVKSDDTSKGAIISIGSHNIGTIYANLNDPSREASVTYKVEFLDHLTGSSISLFPIIGIGDLDFYQSVAVDNALRVLPGSGLSISKSASSILAKSNFSGDTKNDDPRSQAWFLLPNCSTFNYGRLQ